MTDHNNKNVAELVQSATQEPTSGGRKGQDSKIEANRKAGLKVGDPIPTNDKRNDTIRYINSDKYAEAARLNAQFNLAAQSGVGLSPSEPTKGFVIAAVQCSLLDIDIDSTLRNISRADNGIRFSSDDSTDTVPCLNDRDCAMEAQGTDNDATRSVRRDQWDAFINPVFATRPEAYVQKPPVFNQSRRRARLPTGKMSSARNGHTVGGLYDSGAEVCILSTRTAIAWGVARWIATHWSLFGEQRHMTAPIGFAACHAST